MTRLPANLTPMRSVTELRAAVDAFAARYAAARVAAGADKQPLLDAFARLQQAARLNDCSGVVLADRALHQVIVVLADVQGLPKVWETAAGSMEDVRVQSIRACWPDLNVLFQAHRPIVDAICAGDQALAEDAAKAHLDAVWYRLAESTDDASLPDDPLARACTYLDFHLHEPVRLRFLAQYVAKTSPGHLARLFRQRHRSGFTSYLRELRPCSARVPARIRKAGALPGMKTAVGVILPAKQAARTARGLPPKRDLQREVAVLPGALGRVVPFVAIRVGVADDIHPVPRKPLAEMRRIEQVVHHRRQSSVSTTAGPESPPSRRPTPVIRSTPRQ